MPIKKEPTKDLMLKALKLAANQELKADSLKKKGLGLALSILALAETQAQRLGNLGSTVNAFEEEIFKEENFKELDAKEMVRYYILATKQLNATSDFVTKILNSIDWDNLVDKVPALTSGAPIQQSAQVIKTAEILLGRLTQTTIPLGDLLAGGGKGVPQDVIDIVSEVVEGAEEEKKEDTKPHQLRRRQKKNS